jgi:hypothetical protein
VQSGRDLAAQEMVRLGVLLAVLLLESANAVEVERIEAIRRVALVRRKVILDGFQANAVLANTHDNDTARLRLAGFVDLVGECDADLRDGAGRRARAVAEQVLLLRVDDNRLATLSVWQSGNGEATARLALFVEGQLGVVGAFAGEAHLTEEVEGAEAEEADEDDHGEGDQESHGGVVVASFVVAAGSKVLDVEHGGWWCRGVDGTMIRLVLGVGD